MSPVGIAASRNWYFKESMGECEGNPCDYAASGNQGVPKCFASVAQNNCIVNVAHCDKIFTFKNYYISRKHLLAVQTAKKIFIGTQGTTTDVSLLRRLSITKILVAPLILRKRFTVFT